MVRTMTAALLVGLAYVSQAVAQTSTSASIDLPAAESFPVEVTVDADSDEGPVTAPWRFFGADEPNYATMKDGRATLATLGALDPGHVYFRAHNLLTSGDGTPALKWGSTNAYTEDADGNPVYDWHIVDRIFDTYLVRGVKPFVEIGFMPEALSTRPQPYQHDWRPGSGSLRAGWAYPPTDYAKWEELVFQWVRHSVDRYGADEVATWYFETWNEANLPQAYWGGTQEEFFALHDAAIRGVRRALPTARVGGPDNAGAGDKFMSAFIEHVKAEGTPTDFLAFHAKGNPTFVADASGGGHVRMGLAAQLRAADNEFAQIAADPEFRHKPIVIGEADPEGCAACRGPANAYRNGTMYSSYTAASFPRLQELATRRGLKLEGILTWAFEFEDQPYFAGFRQLTSAGIDLPVMNLFKLYARMGGRNLAVASDHRRPIDDVIANGVRGSADVGSTATLDGTSLAVMVWHYHDDDVAGPDAAVSISVNGLPRAFANGAMMTRYLIDRDHGNAYQEWLRMGSPIAPSAEQRTQLIRASELEPVGEGSEPVEVRDGRARLSIKVARQAVTLIVLTHPSGQAPK
jgi:xylan 1,4-beta-xylosidase